MGFQVRQSIRKKETQSLQYSTNPDRSALLRKSKSESLTFLKEKKISMILHDFPSCYILTVTVLYIRSIRIPSVPVPNLIIRNGKIEIGSGRSILLLSLTQSYVKNFHIETKCCFAEVPVPMLTFLFRKLFHNFSFM